jgi:hypothetical protein
MDREGMLQQVALSRAQEAAHDAQVASEARAEAIVALIPDEELMTVAEALSSELTARVGRLYSLDEANPAVVSSKVRRPDEPAYLAFTQSNTTLASAGVTLTIARRESKDKATGSRRYYGLFFPPYSAEGFEDGINISQDSFSLWRHLSSPLPTPSSPLPKGNTFSFRERLAKFVEVAESLGVIEQSCGIEWPPAQPTGEQAWLGQILLGSRPSSAS